MYGRVGKSWMNLDGRGYSGVNLAVAQVSYIIIMNLRVGMNRYIRIESRLRSRGSSRCFAIFYNLFRILLVRTRWLMKTPQAESSEGRVRQEKDLRRCSGLSVSTHPPFGVGQHNLGIVTATIESR